MAVNESAVNAFHATAWREIYNQVDLLSAGLRDGVGPEIENPFVPGGKSRVRLPEDILQLRQAIEPTGLLDDERFLQSFKGALRHALTSAMFGMMTALDGEGRFEGDFDISLVTSEGDEVSGYLHETFGGADPRTA